MILCVTPNAAIDRTAVVPGYSAGGIFRTGDTIVAAGGKGINVARAVQAVGGEAMCAGFLAGHSGRLIADLVAEDGLANAWTFIDRGESRTCTIVVDSDNQQSYVLNEAGIQVTSDDWEKLRDDVLKAEPETVCFCGSLPPGSEPEQYSALLTELHRNGKRVWVDTSGAALHAAANTPGISIKVNDEEIGAMLGREVKGADAAIEAAHDLHKTLSAPVVLTLGADGAVLVNVDGTWKCAPPPVEIQSPVGSGDSFLAGLVVGLEQGKTATDALRQAVAAGTANAMIIGGARFTRQDVDALISQTVLEAL